MTRQILYTAFNKIDLAEKKKLIDFFQTNLHTQHCERIRRALEFAVKERPSYGGFVLSLVEEDEIVGAAVVNQTGMEDFMPGHLLLYFAVQQKYRGNGVGVKLLRQTITYSRGDLAMRIPPDHPDRPLFESQGFAPELIEMRHREVDPT